MSFISVFFLHITRPHGSARSSNLDGALLPPGGDELPHLQLTLQGGAWSPVSDQTARQREKEDRINLSACEGAYRVPASTHGLHAAANKKPYKYWLSTGPRQTTQMLSPIKGFPLVSYDFEDII